MKKKMFTLLTIIGIGLGVFMLFGDLILYPSGAPAGYTGSPADGQDCGSCHGVASSPKSGVITSNVPAAGYTAGSSYTVTVTLTGSGKKGFEVSPQSSSGTLLGTLTAGTGTKLLSSGKYITHSSAISTTPATWTFTWKAPAAGTGNVTFYGAFVIGYSNIYTSTYTVNEAVTAIPPTATTNAASNLLCTGGATLNGSVNPKNASTAVTFEYGTTISYGTKVNATQSPISGNTETTVSVPITGLSVNTTYHYRVTASNINGTTNGSDMTFIIIPQNIYTIDGYLTYDNTVNSPLVNVSLSLLDAQSVLVATTSTDASGHYAFNNIANGTYTITANSSNTVGGIDATDALVINKYFVQSYTFADALKQKAADVDGKNGVNPTDALNIMRFFVKITSSFAAGNWLFNPTTVSINCANTAMSFKGVCVGDPNGSFKP